MALPPHVIFVVAPSAMAPLETVSYVLLESIPRTPQPALTVLQILGVPPSHLNALLARAVPLARSQPASVPHALLVPSSLLLQALAPNVPITLGQVVVLRLLALLVLDATLAILPQANV